MIGTGTSGPNYYDLLGLTPSAAGDAVAQAFSRAANLLRPHVFGRVTELCVAYETLRDPARRRAYDESLGLKPEPKLPPASRPASAHFIARPASAGPHAPVPPPVISRNRPASPPPPHHRPKPPPARFNSPPPRPSAFDDPGAGIRPVEWKRTGAIAGGFAAAAVFVGAMAGWWSGSEAAKPQQLESARSSDQPETRAPGAAEVQPEPVIAAAEARVERPRKSLSAQARAERIDRHPQLPASQAEAQLIQPPEDLADQASSDPLAPETASVPTVAATMPLPHKTVARTIDRIGYSCGAVASAVPVEGAAGVYTVTCSSGQSFQARPVNGRYRFKRLARD